MKGQSKDEVDAKALEGGKTRVCAGQYSRFPDRKWALFRATAFAGVWIPAANQVGAPLCVRRPRDETELTNFDGTRPGEENGDFEKGLSEAGVDTKALGRGEMGAGTAHLLY